MEYRSMRPGEENDVCGLVARVFGTYVAPQYPPEGVDEFLRYAEPKAMAARAGANHLVLVAALNGRVIGMIELRNCDHISLLFVEGEFQRHGIARELVRRAMDACISQQSVAARVTVNSSPNAVEAYGSMGFQALGPERSMNGIRFVPMALEVEGAEPGGRID